MALAEVAGRNIYYELHGRELGEDVPPLVLIMGAGGSCRGWLPLQVSEYAPTRPVLIFDHRGVAESQDPGGPFSTADLADDTARLLDVVGIARANVLGAFMGGMVAQELALRHPARVDKLILVGTYARPDAKRRMLLEDWAALARGGAPLETMVRKRLIWTLQDETLEQADLIETMVSFFTKQDVPVSPDLFARQCEACIQHDAMDRLRDIVHPTLVICGRNDQLTPPKFHRELADEIPDSRLVTIGYGAHLVMVESVERFNQVVLQFLDDARH